MTTILFVDDEPRILSALRRMLFTHRDEWTMHFVENAEEALALMDAKPIDVVITDFRMPAMDGGSFLELVRKNHPTSARLVLSGYTEDSKVADVLGVTDRFLSKPCDAESLVNSINDALRWKAEREVEEAIAQLQASTWPTASESADAA